ncbi:dockerin type I domain-containing protein [Pseudobacteroides cellulosolvens]|uniref:Glycoside hydrolase family 43 n=1 Tax=Pseudobacteroides cellulosolvens ATCC 35603 = DSM 2933 TaxID=398512 RepID=A0A0L6JY09_9FIRM|nr:dockerin type I domain-containing protein [Pseudobacteroides cellulosolvens]KNY30337.1 glycoside hydrolase family 43 [Pseudobacteroides cellulosolvens ATCC 35603 = DSM 2933]
MIIKNFKKILTVIMIFIYSSVVFLSISQPVSAESYSGYIMGYFKQATGEYGLNLCYSTDGLNWKNIKDGKPILYATMGTKGIRDPYIRRKQDGGFVIVATDMLGTTWSDHSQYIHVWESDDLITFKNERLLKVHSTNMHAWAPEVFYDYNKKQYGIIWSGNTNYNRTYVNYTTDFNTITPNEVFFDPGYDVIDSDVIQHNGTAYLFFKDERSSGKSIKGAKSTTLNPNSFTVHTPNFITSAGTEGPFVFKDNNSNTWYMYADLFNQNGKFECWKTTDLGSTSWTKVTNVSVPAGVRHGSVVSVTKTELDGIIAGKPVATPTSTPVPTTTAAPTATLPGTYTLSGYVSPDFSYTGNSKQLLASGFKVEVPEAGKSAVTDQNGYFIIKDLPKNTSGYSIKISKEGYLSKDIKNVIINSNTQLSFENSPIKLMAGDFNGDNAINMSDVIILAKSFNSISNDSKYAAGIDLNRDGSINMSDVLILAMNFNKTSLNY